MLMAGLTIKDTVRETVNGRICLPIAPVVKAFGNTATLYEDTMSVSVE